MRVLEADELCVDCWESCPPLDGGVRGRNRGRLGSVQLRTECGVRPLTPGWRADDPEEPSEGLGGLWAYERVIRSNGCR